MLAIPAIGQNFGCYSEPSDNGTGYDKLFTRKIEGFTFSLINDFNWSEYEPKRCVDGWYAEHVAFDFFALEAFKMEGCLVEGKRQGLWTFFDQSNKVYVVGNFENDLKEGLWKALHINLKGDTICLNEVVYRNDLPEGMVKEYFSTGQKYREAFYEFGKLNGYETLYARSDTASVVVQQQLYLNGLPEGPKTEFRDNHDYVNEFYACGQLHGKCKFNTKEIEFNNGKLHGVYSEQYYNGVIACEIEFRNNKPWTSISAHDITGRTLNPGTLHEGNGTLIVYDDSGKVKSEFEYQNQLIYGKMLHYNYKGDTIEYGLLFTDSLPTYKNTSFSKSESDVNLAVAWTLNFSSGTNYRDYYNNGKTHFIIASVKEDTIQITEFSKEGIVIRKQKIYRGLPAGADSTFHEGGQLRSTGKYSIVEKNSKFESVKSGWFRYYYPNGVLQAEVFYNDGTDTEKSFFYDDAGNLRRVYVPNDNGASYSVFDVDTVNRTDACGRKQGKWIGFTRSNSYDLCSTSPDEIKYYQNDIPYGLWIGGAFYTELYYIINSDSAWRIGTTSKGKYFIEGLLLNGERVGEWQELDWDGRICRAGSYCNNEREGVWKFYRKNGKVKETVFYQKGQIVH